MMMNSSEDPPMYGHHSPGRFKRVVSTWHRQTTSTILTHTQHKHLCLCFTCISYAVLKPSYACPIFQNKIIEEK
jgi:hypothetical protein